MAIQIDSTGLFLHCVINESVTKQKYEILNLVLKDESYLTTNDGT